MKRGEEVPGDALPQLAHDLIMTRNVNSWLKTNYTVEEVAEFPPEVFTVLSAVASAWGQEVE
ncbi:MAG: hypothetical protein WC977_07985 [Anaerovoracaceae bacterium]|jgi:hypothetical protein